MKAVVAAFNQEKALVGAFSVITNLRMELFEALDPSLTSVPRCSPGRAAYPCYPGYYPQLSPGKHPAYSEAAHPAVYPGYSGDTAAEFIQPCHIFQVSAAPCDT